MGGAPVSAPHLRQGLPCGPHTQPATLAQAPAQPGWAPLGPSVRTAAPSPPLLPALWGIEAEADPAVVPRGQTGLAPGWTGAGAQSPGGAAAPWVVTRPAGGHASPPSTCSGAPRRPRSGATDTPWWPLTATSMCSGALLTTPSPTSCTATTWTSRPGRSSSPARIAR